MNKKQNKNTKQVEKKVIEKNEKSFFDEKIAPHSIKITAFLIILIGIFAFRKYLTLEYLFFFKDIGSDTINLVYPSLAYVMNLSKEGLINKYSFYTGMGDVYYTTFPSEPLGWLLTVINKIGMSVSGVDYLVYRPFVYRFIHYFLLTGILFYFYLRTVKFSEFSSLIGALIISFSGYLVVGSSWDFDSHVFKAVFLLFSFEQLYLKKRWYFMPFAIIYLSSNLFVLYLYSFFLLIYSIFRYFSEKENLLKGYFQLTGKIALLGISGLLMNANSIGSSFMKMFFSPRVAGNASYSSLLSEGQNIIDNSTLGATTIYRFFSSDLLGSGSNFAGWSNYLEAPLFYIGLLTLLVFPQVFVFLDKRKKIVFGAFFIFWISTLFIPYFRHAILLFTGDYFRYGFDFFIPFTLLLFAVYSLNEIDKNFKVNLPLLIGTFIILMILLFLPYDVIPKSSINLTLRKIVLFLMLIYGYLIFLLSKPQYKTIAQVGILFLVVFELSYFSYTSYKDRVPLTKTEYKSNSAGYDDGTIDAVDYIKSTDKTLFYRTEKDYQSGSAVHGSLNDAQAQGYYGTTSYSSFNQLNYIRFMEEIQLIQKGDETSSRWSRGFRDNPLLQSFASVKYHLSKSEYPFFQNVGFDSIATIEGVKILKNNYYLPFGFTYDKYISLDDFKSLIKYCITEQSLFSIKAELMLNNEEATVSTLLQKLIPIVNIKYPDKEQISSEITGLLGKEISDEVSDIILKYSVDNFTAQVALLNGFVYEDDEFSFYGTSNFSKISLADSSVLLTADKFSFEKYKLFTDSLKIDTLQIYEFKQSEIKGIIDLSSEKMLFLSIPYDKGWKIKVDGKSEKLSRVNIGFTGIVLTAGKHEIELYYVPQYSKITSVISIISIIGFWLFLGFYIYSRKTKKEDN